MKPWFVGGVAAAFIAVVCFVVFVVPTARQVNPIKDRQATNVSQQLREQLTLDGCVNALQTNCIELLKDIQAASGQLPADPYSISASQASVSRAPGSQVSANVEAKNPAR